ncbi:MAG: hypothetical protein IJG33_13495 [Selenomonadaceae bacterium]|nr:hypothetical protein [Selenomonadaceae bacterium]
METYLQFNPASTIRVEEQVSVVDNRAFLRHIPKKGSVVIDGFTEVDGAPQANQFYCDYATDSLYRDANRVLHFGSVNDYTDITVNYIAIGTVVTADDMNEIKAHLENDSLHGGSDGYFKDNSTKMIYTGGLDFNNIDDEYWAIDSRIGRGLDESFQSEVGRAPKVGDIVQYYAPGNDTGYTIRTSDKWVNLGYFGEDDTSWDAINPLLSLADRQKLAINPLFGFVPFSEKAGDIPLSPEGRKRFDDHKQYGEILVDLDHIEERKNAIDNDEDVNEDDYEGNYTLITRQMQDNDVDNIFYLGSEWGDICPLLTVKDRKLLDYLHAQLDDQLD